MAELKRGRVPDNLEEVDHLIEITGVYDGWSIAVLKDGTVCNRWGAGFEITRPREGYERRFRATEAYIEKWLTDEPHEQFPLFDELDKEDADG